MPNDTDRIRVKHSITPDRIDALKARLSELIPEVRASHRVEALARGLEFRTWASLLAWKRAPDGDAYRPVDADAFVGYLASHGFAVPGIAFDCAMSLTRRGRGGLIPVREEALKSMGQDTWDAFASGNRAFEDKVNEQIEFIRVRWDATATRRTVNKSASTTVAP
ncbi:hypothetical protein [Rhizobium sp. BK176]|uniref:hypothetical protein n=1 Tax=Rhizobium sp. BK176 TaxID=2587071 RepID=UPI002167F344|nr:hypothetical protein [Rhizobium sp. BK176]MCS4090167.1 hypothetical protein [Rhizobium sp. BK176]